QSLWRCTPGQHVAGRKRDRAAARTATIGQAQEAGWTESGSGQGKTPVTSTTAWRVLALALCAALGAPGASAETLRVGKAGRDAFSFAPADIGVRTGIFKQHGLDLEISSFGGDVRVQQAMTADGIDVGLGSGPGLAFIVKGSPVKGIAGMARTPT